MEKSKRKKRAAKVSVVAWLTEYFRAMRFDQAHHLGMGDIWLTMGQQEEIVAEVKRALRKAKQNGAQKHLSSEERRAIAALIFSQRGKNLIRGKHMFRVAHGQAT